MNCHVKIRAANESDVDKVIAYVAELRAERLPTILRYESIPTRDEELRFFRRFADDSADYFVAEVDDRIIGNLGIAIYEHPQTAHGASLGMSVLQSFRGRGIGTMLLTTALQWCEIRSLRRLELEVLSNNPSAQRLYERFGFVVEGRREGAVAVDGEFMDAIVMCRRMGPAA